MAKEEVASWPVFGYLARRGGIVFVKRESTLHRLQALFKGKKVLQQQALCIFPEGTTTAEIAPQKDQWKRGNIYLARHAGRPTFCLGLHYRDHEHLAWIDEQELLSHLLKILARPSMDLFLVGERFKISAELTLSELSQTAYQTVCRLSASAAKRSLKDSAGR